MMLKEKLILCVVRTVAAVLGLALFVGFIRYTHADYDDLKTVLSILNAYLPEFVLLSLFSAIALIFYRASVADNEFNFVNFFISKPGKHEDIFKFGYFALLVTCIWVLFTMVWREKLTEGILGVILGAFILKSIADVGGKIWGSKPRPPDPKD